VEGKEILFKYFIKSKIVKKVIILNKIFRSKQS